jgi:hypothetical protein
MTDISTAAPIKVRRFSLPRLGFPRPGTGAALTGMFGLINDAFRMAYVDPYTSLHRRPQSVTDDDLEGRDPNW